MGQGRGSRALGETGAPVHAQPPPRGLQGDLTSKHSPLFNGAAREKIRAAPQKSLACDRLSVYLPLAQIRTCLWPCVGRWASGQEAGQPPGEEALFLATVTGSRRRNRRTPRSTGDAA